MIHHSARFAVLLCAASALAARFVLAPLFPTSLNTALQLGDREAAAQSPLLWPAPKGKILDAVVGGDESSEYLRQSYTIVERWGEAGVRTRYEEIEGANHFTVIAPLSDAASAMCERLHHLATRL